MDNRFNGKPLKWIKGKPLLEDRSSPEPVVEDVTPKKSCVSCISYIEGVCPRVTLGHYVCGAYNQIEYYELCALIKAAQEVVD